MDRTATEEPFTISPADVYRRYAGEFVRFATGLVGADAAEDVMSRAITKALTPERWGRIRDHRAYLYQAVLDEARSFHRRRVRRSLERHLAATLRHHLDPEPRPDVVAAVVRLSPRQRAVILLTYWADLAPGEVSRRLGIAEGTVRRHLARARLREVLHE